MEAEPVISPAPPAKDEVVYAVAKGGNPLRIITTGDPSPTDLVFVSARIPGFKVGQNNASTNFVGKRLKKVVEMLMKEFKPEEIARAKLRERRYEELPFHTTNLDPAPYRREILNSLAYQPAPLQVAVEEEGATTAPSDSSEGGAGNGLGDEASPVPPSAPLNDAKMPPQVVVGKKRAVEGEGREGEEAKRSRGPLENSKVTPKVGVEEDAASQPPLPEWVLMQSEDLLSEKMRLGFIRGKLERRVLKLDNRVVKLKGVLERQNELVNNQAREADQLRELKRSADSSIESLRTQLNSKEEEVEHLRRNGVSKLPAGLPEDASEQQRLYHEAVKEAEEARAESQYHEEQFTRMAVETSKAKDKLHETRDVLIAAAKDDGPLTGVLELKSVGEIIEEDLEVALTHDFKRKPNQRQLDEAFDELDGALRNPQVQPLIMHEGHVRGVNKRDPFLLSLKSKYGSHTAKYFLEKLRESEEYNPSGRYPVVVLWKGDREMEVSEAVLQCVRTIHSLRKKNRKLKKMIQGSGMVVPRSSSKRASKKQR